MEQIDISALFVAIPVVVLTITFVIVLYEPSTPHPDRIERSDSSAILGLFSRWQWGLTVGFAILFVLTGIHIATGIAEIEPIEAVIRRFDEWGYSEGFRLFIGITEVLAAMLLIPRQTAPYSAGYLSVIMAGSIYTHIAYGTWGLAVIPLVCLSGLVYLVVARSRGAKKMRAATRQPQRA